MNDIPCFHRPLWKIFAHERTRERLHGTNPIKDNLLKTIFNTKCTWSFSHGLFFDFEIAAHRERTSIRRDMIQGKTFLTNLY